MAQSALTAPPPKETPSLDLHHQERSNQADAFGLDDMHIVYNHTHSIITSSNARVDEWEKGGGWTGLLSMGARGARPLSGCEQQTKL